MNQNNLNQMQAGGAIPPRFVATLAAVDNLHQQTTSLTRVMHIGLFALFFVTILAMAFSIIVATGNAGALFNVPTFDENGHVVYEDTQNDGDKMSTTMKVIVGVSGILIFGAVGYTMRMWSNESRWARINIAYIGYTMTFAFLLLGIGMFIDGNILNGSIVMGMMLIVFLVFVFFDFFLNEYETKGINAIKTVEEQMKLIDPTLRQLAELQMKHKGEIPDMIEYMFYMQNHVIPNLLDIYDEASKKFVTKRLLGKETAILTFEQYKLLQKI